MVVCDKRAYQWKICLIDEQLERVGDEPGRVTDDEDDDHQDGGPGVTRITLPFLSGSEFHHCKKNIVKLYTIYKSVNANVLKQCYNIGLSQSV